MREALHKERELIEFVAHAIEVAAFRLDAAGDGAGVTGRDAEATCSEEAADEFAGLPDIEAGLQQFGAQCFQVGLVEAGL